MPRAAGTRDGIANYHWELTDGTTSSEPLVPRIYHQPGTYSEIVRVRDKHGHQDVDFAIVKVVAASGETVPGIHATYHPSIDVRAGDPITFKVRARYTDEGIDTWDFGDGTETVAVKSNQSGERHALDAYVPVIHRFAKAGNYIVKVHRTTSAGNAMQAIYTYKSGKKRSIAHRDNVMTTQPQHPPMIYTNPYDSNNEMASPTELSARRSAMGDSIFTEATSTVTAPSVRTNFFFTALNHAMK